MQQAEIRERLASAGLEPMHYGAAAMGAYVRRQREGFAAAIRAANIRVEG
jgi:hypothetical protein